MGQTLVTTNLVSGLAPLLLLVCATALHAQPIAAHLPAHLTGGLAVMAGPHADDHALQLAAQGRWLVRLLADDAAQAQTWQESTAQLHPLITVAQRQPTLPFAEQTVNLVVLAATGAIDPGEARRVLAPGGVLLLPADAGFSREIIPADPRHALWTHWLADAHGSGVSQDTAVAPSNSLRWWSQRMVGTQIRTVSGVVAVFEDELGSNRRLTSGSLQALDVYSGVPLWHRERAVVSSMYNKRTAAVAHRLGVIHAVPGEMQPVVLSDLRSGEVQRTFEHGLRMPVKQGDPDNLLGGTSGGRSGGIGEPILLVWEDTLVQVYGLQVAALDIPTGRLQWQIRLEHGATKTIISRDGRRLYLQESAAPTRSYLRWGSFPTVALTALQMADGKTLWRNDQWRDMQTLREGRRVIGTPFLSELIELGDTLYAWDHASNIGSDHHGDLFAIDPRTGRIMWHFEDANGKDPKHHEYHKHGPMTNNLVAWNNALFSKEGLYHTTGPTRDTRAVRFLGGNQRCVRLSGATNYLVYGFTSFMDRQGNSFQTGLIRGNCAMPNYATYGAVLSVTDETCNCYNGLRGQLALVPPRPVVPVADAARLQRHRPQTQPAKATAPADLPDSAITQDGIPWPSLRFYPDHQRTAVVQVGSLWIQDSG